MYRRSNKHRRSRVFVMLYMLERLLVTVKYLTGLKFTPAISARVRHSQTHPYSYSLGVYLKIISRNPDLERASCYLTLLYYQTKGAWATLLQLTRVQAKKKKKSIKQHE